MTDKEEKIEDYIFDNEQFDWNDIICPYCKAKQSDVDPSVKYNEQEGYELDCDTCGRTFILQAEMCFHYTTKPTREEAEYEVNQMEEEDDDL